MTDAKGCLCSWRTTAKAVFAEVFTSCGPIKGKAKTTLISGSRARIITETTGLRLNGSTTMARANINTFPGWPLNRSEERSGGTEGVRTCRSRWSQSNEKKTTKKNKQ